MVPSGCTAILQQVEAPAHRHLHHGAFHVDPLFVFHEVHGAVRHRSGLGIKSLVGFGKLKAGMETLYSFGPYAYPIQTIRKDISRPNPNGSKAFEYHAIADNDDGNPVPVDQVKVWSYKFDTLSVGPRALAMQHEVEQNPACLLTTFPPCPNPFLSLETAFLLLDGLLEAIQSILLGDKSPCAAFAVEHQWINTMEQTLFGFLCKEPFTRYFTLHTYHRDAMLGTSPVELLAICNHQQQDTRCHRPSFCSTTTWPTSFRFPNANSPETVSIDECISLRFARFQVENPTLDMELLVMIARNVQWIQNTAAVSYDRNNQEILAFIRGRRCDFDAGRQTCETVVIDDYRYERSLLQTNIEELFGVVACIRGIDRDMCGFES